MELTLIIIAVTLSAVTLVFSVILFVSVLRKNKASDGGKNISDAIVSLNANLQSVHNDLISVKADVSNYEKNIPLVISSQLAEQMVKVQKQLGDQSN